MNLVNKITQKLRLKYHKREIAKSLIAFKKLTGRSAERQQVYSDSGTFRSQIERLFSLGSAAETGELERIATAAVYSCLSNKYYRPADFLSDILDAMERQTYLSFEPEGEPPLHQCSEALRARKLKLIIEFFLIPAKVASIETILRHFAKIARKRIPYQALATFERHLARLYEILGESETTYMEKEIIAFLDRWKTDPSTRQRFPEPSDAFPPIMGVLLGEESVDIASTLRLRKPGLPLRLSTLVPEDRQYLLRTALSRIKQTQG